MIHILAGFKVKNDKLSDFIKLCNELIEESRKEEGCVSYHLQQNTERENYLVFVEEWKSNEAIEKHNSSEHFTRIVPLLVEMCEDAPVIQTFDRLV
ncbi:putative quinol monooxygenase [Leptotrichia buccalis]|uniref:Antibiotic biosynthesis monooxygenase n=1 Tax=Leptotrichia buccalis (strain ATCC 14201 / DSM 1135 / JCM 12969 / NCTC 10249 / C-1013-b) TaxID=523794 RepID=C7ND78_LEPBD|nr:putative quinol monooxygenase [Leptotrichia buccalis]ACV39956.1 Antibiotic biosynthesis monooxygenase [Leptotrichia buccalis C-1013-b]